MTNYPDITTSSDVHARTSFIKDEIKYILNVNKCISDTSYNHIKVDDDNIYIKADMKKCTGLTKTGVQCKSNPLKDSDKCKHHSKHTIDITPPIVESIQPTYDEYLSDDERDYYDAGPDDDFDGGPCTADTSYQTIRVHDKWCKNAVFTDISTLDAWTSITTSENPVILMEAIYGDFAQAYDFDPEYKTQDDANINFTRDVKAAVSDITKFCEANDMPVSINVFAAPRKKGDAWRNSIRVVNNAIITTSGMALKKLIIAHAGWTNKPDPAYYKNRGKRMVSRLIGTAKPGEENSENACLLPTTVNSDGSLTITPRKSITFDQFVLSVLSTGTQTPSSDKEVPMNDDAAEYRDYFAKFSEQRQDLAASFMFKCGKKTKRGCIISTTRLNNRPSWCHMCERYHDNDNTLCILIDGTPDAYKMFWKCTKAPTSTSRFVYSNIDENRNVADVISRANKYPYNASADIEALEKATNTQVISVNAAKCSDVKPFMNDIETGIGLIGIKSNMNTGKTYAASMAITKDKNTRVGFVSHRRSIAMEGKRKFDGLGFTMYLDAKKDQKITASRWITQMDSLHKVDQNRSKDGYILDVLFLDEADQLIKHLTSSTYMKQRRFDHTYKAFVNLVKYSKRVIIMDACLTAHAWNTIANMREKKEGAIERIYYNTHVGDSPVDVKVVNSSARIIQRIDENVKASQRFYLAINAGIKTAETIKKTIESHADRPIKILIIASTEQRKDDVSALICDVKNITLYDGIIATPSIQGGVSFDDAGDAHSIYGIFKNQTNGSADALQQLRRIRKPTNRTIYVHLSQTSSSQDLTTAANVREYVLANRKHACLNEDDADKARDQCESKHIDEYGDYRITTNTFFNIFCENTAIINDDRQHFIYNFTRHVMNYGGSIKMEDDDESETQAERIKEIRVDMKRSEQETKDDHTSRIQHARDIDKAQYDKLRDADPTTLSDDDVNAMQKHYVLDRYNLHGVEVSEISWHHINDNSTMALYDNLSPYYETAEPRPFTECIERMKTREADAIKGIQMKEGVNGVESSAENDVIASIIAIKTKYQKHRILTEWLGMMGMKRFSDEIRDIKCDDMRKIMIAVKQSYLAGDHGLNTAKILGRDAKKIQNIDGADLRHMLRFVNGLLKKEFAISIGKVKDGRHDKQEYNVHKSVKLACFNDPYGEQDSRKKGLPTLGSKYTKSEDIVHVYDQRQPASATDIMKMLECASM